MENDNGKRKMIVVRVTDAEKNALQEKAGEYHINVSRYLIMLGLKGKVQ